MYRTEHAASDSPEIHVESVSGSLQIKGGSDGRIVIEARRQEDLHFSMQDNSLTLSADSDCILRVPEESSLHIESVSKDAYVQAVEAEIHVEDIGGSLTLKSVGPAHIENVSGNLFVRGVEGDLQLDEISGNVTLRDVEGDLQAEEVHGNFGLRNVEGDVDVKSDGNADLRIEAEGHDIRVVAGGNLFCNLESPGNAEVSFQSGAQSIHISTDDGKQFVKAGKHEITLGDGSTEMELVAGGHIDFRCQKGKTFSVDFDLDFGDEAAGLADEISEQVSSQVESQLESLNAQMEALSERLSHEGGRAARHAQRKVAAAQRQLQRKLQRHGIHGGVIPHGKAPDPVSEKERMLILQMVQDKKISVEQAEMLLNTLEGRPQSPPKPQEPEVTPSEGQNA